MIRGVKTSEFWVTLATLVMGALGLGVPTAAGTTPSATALGTFASAAAAGIAYVLSRAHVKASTAASGAEELRAAIGQLVDDLERTYGGPVPPATTTTGSQVVTP